MPTRSAARLAATASDLTASAAVAHCSALRSRAWMLSTIDTAAASCGRR